MVNLTAQHVWDMLKKVWIDTYTGLPDFIVHDAGTQFKSREFIQSALMLAIYTKCVPVEAHHSIGLVERYHQMLRRAFTILVEDLAPIGIGRDAILQTSIKAINDTAGPGVIIPTLLVFGTFPRMHVSDAPSFDIITRAKAIKKAMTKVRQLKSMRNVTEALK